MYISVSTQENLIGGAWELKAPGFFFSNLSIFEVGCGY